MRTAMMLLLQFVSIGAMTAMGVGIIISVSNDAPSAPLIAAMTVNAGALVVIAWKVRSTCPTRRGGRD